MIRIIFLTLLTICSFYTFAEESNLKDVFTKDSAFGITKNTTITELTNTIQMKKLSENSYQANTIIKPVDIFNKYFYIIKDEKVCQVWAIKDADITQIDAVKADFTELKNSLSKLYGEPELTADKSGVKWIIPENNNFISFGFAETPDKKNAAMVYIMAFNDFNGCK